MEKNNAGAWLRAIMITVVLAGITACNGGGGGSSSPAPPPPPPEDTFEPGVFEASTNFRALCAAPRTGINPATSTPFPDAQGTSKDENNWLRSWSNELYLWYDEITDVDPANTATPDYFDLMQTFAVTPSGAPRDKFHFLFPTDEWRELSQSGVSAGYGAQFALIEVTPPRRAAVAYTEPDSPATASSVQLVRGTLILEVDGADLVYGTSNSDIDKLNAGLFPENVGETHNFKIRDPGGTTRNISMTSARITSDPVQNVSTIDTGSGLVGYMLFNDHIATSEQELVDAINLLAGEGVTDLILDIRYNGGGFLGIANELAFMIAGPSAAQGRTFEEIKFNDKHPTFNPINGESLSPTPFQTTAHGFSAEAGTELPYLNLPRVFVLTGSGTCSASEAIMNGLRGIDVEVIQIGSTTCGKPYGFYPFDNCGTTYFSIQFKGVNEKGFGDYTDGFSPSNTTRTEGTIVPGCSVADDFSQGLGNPQEARLAAALGYRVDQICPTPSGFNQAGPLAIESVTSKPAFGLQVPKNFWLQNRIMGK